MNIHKLKNVIALNEDDRYWYTVREIVKLGNIWAVATPEAYVTFVNNEGKEVFPIWPHKEVAEICLLEEMKVDGYFINAIPYDKFKQFCIPDMVDSGILFGVFYNDKRVGIELNGNEFLSDLIDEEG